METNENNPTTACSDTAHKQITTGKKASRYFSLHQHLLWYIPLTGPTPDGQYRVQRCSFFHAAP